MQLLRKITQLFKRHPQVTTRKGTPEVSPKVKSTLKLFPDYEPRWEKEWPHFATLLQNRLRQGHEEYGDESFDMSPIRLIQEIQEEALDIVGWAFILYVRLSDLEKKTSSPVAGNQDTGTKEDKFCRNSALRADLDEAIESFESMKRTALDHSRSHEYYLDENIKLRKKLDEITKEKGKQSPI